MQYRNQFVHLLQVKMEATWRRLLELASEETQDDWKFILQAETELRLGEINWVYYSLRYSEQRVTNAVCYRENLCYCCYIIHSFLHSFHDTTATSWPRSSLCWRFTITLASTVLDTWSARSRDLYPTVRSTQKRQTSVPPVGFEPAIPAIERPQNYA